MKSTQKLALIYALALVLSISLAIQFASAQEQTEYTASTLTEEELDRVLAPIALYPDTLLTHVLIASTYPLDVIRAARWRDKNEGLDHDDALAAVEDFDWDPSVKALAPFNDVLQKMAEDIDWLNYLGDSMVADEEWVMARVQALRTRAYAQGNLNNNDYIAVEREDDVIVIETVRERVVYVPFYDTHVVYGSWWHHHNPYYWHHPRHYRAYHSGFYWGPSIRVSTGFFFGGFHWRHGYVVVNPHYRVRGYSGYRHGYKRVYSREYQRWSHNVQHRKARYNNRVITHYNARRSQPAGIVSSREAHSKVQVQNHRQVQTREYGDYQKAVPLELKSQRRVERSNVIRTAKPSESRKVNRNDVVRPNQPAARVQKSQPSQRIDKYEAKQDRVVPTKVPQATRNVQTQRSVQTKTVTQSQRSHHRSKPSVQHRAKPVRPTVDREK
ncbi:DUF3300 domain-containing protein [Alteromonas oceanisediminis]|uniref:DUF3300 domain-containing protein n=1 Tax=Alteromonas oceanisediminis TaxID=2836180 RepID=UPI001BD92083|nr:DUF3300 domain-containing protein [Alteromonas oceanisediminis]MBT0586830.1 DUF3300 domain-containing protein [Alteromonas oceanisediminis]